MNFPIQLELFPKIGNEARLVVTRANGAEVVYYIPEENLAEFLFELHELVYIYSDTEF